MVAMDKFFFTRGSCFNQFYSALKNQLTEITKAVTKSIFCQNSPTLLQNHQPYFLSSSSQTKKKSLKVDQ